MASTNKPLVNDMLQGALLHTMSGDNTYDEVSSTNPLPVSTGSAVEKVTYTATVAKSATETIGPFSMEKFGKLTVMILAQRLGTFDVYQQLQEDSASATNIINDQATVADTLYTTAELEVKQGWASVAWTNGDAANTSTLVVQVVKEGSVGNAEVVPYDSSAVELFSDTNPGSIQLRLADGSVVGTTTDPLPVGLTTAAGAAIGEAAAAPLFGELVNSSAAELFTTTTPGQVEALITDGAGTAVSQSVSADYATITVWEVAAQAVPQAATYTGTGRDCLYMARVCCTAQADYASSADGCLVQESNDNSTWYTLSKCTLAAGVNTILYAGPRSRRYVRIVYTEADAHAAVFNASISASPQ